MQTRLKHTALSTVIAIALGLAALALALRPAGTPVARASGQYTIYLPVIANMPADVLAPTASQTLSGGNHNFASISIPAGVTVTVLGAVVLNVSGDINIAGALVADCYTLDLEGLGNLAITGVVNNTCSTPSPTPGDLILHTHGGHYSIGTVTTPAHISTSGQLDVTNAPQLQSWEFDVLPSQRSAAPLPPVCSAHSDILLDSVLPVHTAEVAFTGSGADPNGGPVTYSWDFGDGGSDTGETPVHAYATGGVFDVTLTVTDRDNQSCRATLRVVLDDSGATSPVQPALWAEPAALVAANGQGVAFSAQALSAQGQALTYVWSFGDGGTSTTSSPVYTYTNAGRYAVLLTVADTDGHTSTAAASIYIYPASVASQTSAARQAGLAVAAGDCLVAGGNVFNAVAAGGQAGPRATGRSMFVSGTGDVYLGPGTDIHAQDGADGANAAGAGTQQGGNGTRGGSLEIDVDGHLTVCGGATLAAGDGGRGGNAISNTPAPGAAVAKGGNGGPAAHRLRLSATEGLTFDSSNGAPITIRPGSGGDGGQANATGGDGAANCPIGDTAATAWAKGGIGGEATKFATTQGSVGGLANIVVGGGRGGLGGPATAVGGQGGTAACAIVATGGLGQRAKALGGQGGNADFIDLVGVLLEPGAYTAGRGGDGTALGGWGGNAIAAGLPDATAAGGAAGKAEAVGGQGGRGHTDGDGGNAVATGGQGGAATATGQAGLPCQKGGTATATGGPGADANAKFGNAGGASGSDGTATSTGGKGGNAAATGGKGGDCPNCPAGQGGAGGDATATGGKGGNATGNGVRVPGNGGDGSAAGGKGGHGANCCNLLPGGAGGKGGDANSTAGQPGTPAGGSVGANSLKGGDGGDGGDGDPPGVGGDFGLGQGRPIAIPNGNQGRDGSPCPTGATWWLLWDGIVDGPITPGNTYSLSTYSGPATRTGAISLHFMNATEFGAPAAYQKTSNVLLIQAGGLVFDLSSIASNFHTQAVDVGVQNSCGTAGCVWLAGYYHGEMVGLVQSPAGAGAQVLHLPNPPTGVPYYDKLVLLIHGRVEIHSGFLLLQEPGGG